VRIKNELVPETEGGYTRIINPTNDISEAVSIYDAAMHYQANKTPLIVIAGKEYGTGSSRDWAAKGTRLLGVRAVIAESFERIHRSNLIGMGVLPLQFLGDDNRKTLALDGSEHFSLAGLNTLKTAATMQLTITRSNGETQQCALRCRLDTDDELSYYNSGGILHYVLEQLLKK
jgi:aconitate hydratase